MWVQQVIPSGSSFTPSGSERKRQSVEEESGSGGTGFSGRLREFPFRPHLFMNERSEVGKSRENAGWRGRELDSTSSA